MLFQRENSARYSPECIYYPPRPLLWTRKQNKQQQKNLYSLLSLFHISLSSTFSVTIQCWHFLSQMFFHLQFFFLLFMFQCTRMSTSVAQAGITKPHKLDGMNDKLTSSTWRLGMWAQGAIRVVFLPTLSLCPDRTFPFLPCAQSCETPEKLVQ